MSVVAIGVPAKAVPADRFVVGTGLRSEPEPNTLPIRILTAPILTAPRIHLLCSCLRFASDISTQRRHGYSGEPDRLIETVILLLCIVRSGRTVLIAMTHTQEVSHSALVISVVDPTAWIMSAVGGCFKLGARAHHSGTLVRCGVSYC